MITINEILQNNQMKDLTLITNELEEDVFVKGINQIESIDLFQFVRRNELIFVTGINFDDIDYSLLEMLKFGQKNHVAGFVINNGPYIENVPEVVIERANQFKIPILIMPWRIRIADITKSILRMIIASEEQENSISVVMNHLVSDSSGYLDPTITKALGFVNPTEYGVILVEVAEHHEKSMREIHKMTTTVLQERYRFFLTERKNNELIYLVNRSDVKSGVGGFSETGQKLYQKMKKKNILIYIGMGNFYEKISDLRNSYQEALQVMSVVKKQQNNLIFKYKNLGVYKLLLALKDTEVLHQFYRELLVPLLAYDLQNNQKYVDFLKVYLEEDGKTINVCKRLYIHRNTVMYKINKVEQILDMDLHATLDKTSLSLAFLIEDLPEA